jgi:conjugal transfer pilus assembly protein TraD
MFSHEAKKKNSPEGVDFVTPIVEIITDLINALLQLLGLGIQYGINHYKSRKALVRTIEQKELKSTKSTLSVEDLGFSISRGRPISFSGIDFSKHSSIFGAAGFGKTNLISILQENSLQNNRPIIFFDPKGDLEALLSFKSLCEKYQKKCLIFSEHYKDSINLNPVKNGSVNQIVDRIMTSFEWTEPFYKDICQDVLMKSVTDLRTHDKIISIGNIIEIYETKYLTEKTLGLLLKLKNIHTSDFGKILTDNGEALTFEDIREKNVCLYIGLSTQGYGETAMSLGKIFLGELLFNSYYQLIHSPLSSVSIAKPISVFFDEFGALVTPRFIELQNKCRGAGIQLYLAVQSVADIDRVDPNLSTQIIENSANLFILKQRVDSGASLLANAIGTVKSKKHTYKMENGYRQDAGSEREVNEHICHPDIIKNLRVGQCVLLRHNPTMIDLINIRERGHEQNKQVVIQKPKEVAQRKFDPQQGLVPIKRNTVIGGPIGRN